jgi:hypothetical protein
VEQGLRPGQAAHMRRQDSVGALFHVRGLIGGCPEACVTEAMGDIFLASAR